jgi:phosphatidylinositol alpha-1,6-mannosyltransferase
MRWHQNISNEELRDLYVASDVFVFPAVNDGWHVEGFGIVCIEAQAAGLPVVTSMESGTEDTVRNGETGILVAQNDITGVATAIISLLRSNEAYSRFSNAARAWAMRFDVT